MSMIRRWKIRRAPKFKGIGLFDCGLGIADFKLATDPSSLKLRHGRPVFAQSLFKDWTMALGFYLLRTCVAHRLLCETKTI